MKLLVLCAVVLLLCVFSANASPPLALPYEDQWVWIRTEKKSQNEPLNDVNPEDFAELFLRGAPTIFQPKIFYNPCTRCPACCRAHQV
ncbi:hypothetical protein L596_023314 [Steinernema carpocapsae]|uniref:Uncharacterized protein n=1 Tax=Steinernema carpocapsae TaxID=34508 RepID=A0A4U5MDH5_STECR|nr:hypothetical protein L596_023314 [Steinernema carpocapsae]